VIFINFYTALLHIKVIKITDLCKSILTAAEQLARQQHRTKAVVKLCTGVG